jgi:hypothetical protein
VPEPLVTIDPPDDIEDALAMLEPGALDAFVGRAGQGLATGAEFRRLGLIDPYDGEDEEDVRVTIGPHGRIPEESSHHGGLTS